MKKLFLAILSLFGILAHSQENPLGFFGNLVDRTWKAEGTWGDGSQFKQEIKFHHSLEKNLIVAQSKGHTNEAQTQFGPKSHGIRMYDTVSKTVRFWEFDIFGSVTTGTVTPEGKNIRYTYAYGESAVTDLWEFVDGDTYIFKVGDYQNGEWKQVYLDTKFTANPGLKTAFHFDHQSLVVENLMETGDFYRDVLGFTEIPHPEGKPRFQVVHYLRQFTIAPHQKRYAQGQKGQKQPPLSFHSGFGRLH